MERLSPNVNEYVDTFIDGLRDSSLVNTVLVIATSRNPQHASPFPLNFDRVPPFGGRINEPRGQCMVERDPEHQELMRNIMGSILLKPDISIRSIPSMGQYTRFLNSDSPALGKVYAASPIFREYMKKSAHDGMLGPYFQRLLRIIETGDQEAIGLLMSAPEILEVFGHWDEIRYWLDDRVYWERDNEGLIARIKSHGDDYEKREINRLQAAEEGLASHRRSILEVSVRFRKFGDEFLSIIFDSKDNSDWRKFLIHNFPLLAATFTPFDPESYNPYDDYQRIKSLYEAVSEHDRGFLASYFQYTSWSRGQKAKELFDQEILNGHTENAKAFTAFNETIESGDNPDSHFKVYFGNESDAIEYWINKFVSSQISKDRLLAVADGWYKRRQALFSHPVPFRMELGQALVPLLKQWGTYRDGEIVAQLVNAGLVPDKSLRDKIRKNMGAIDAITTFGRSVAAIPKDKFHSDSLPIIHSWTERLLENEIEIGDLDNITRIIKGLRGVKKAVLEDSNFSEGSKKHFMDFFNDLYKSPSITKFAEVPGASTIITLFSIGIFPTDRIFYTLAIGGNDAINQLLALKKETDEGRFDPTNSLQKDLEYGKYLSIVGAYPSNYQVFLDIPFVETLDTDIRVSEEEQIEVEATALEAARVYWLIKERVKSGRHVAVIGNQRYGKLFVIDPIREDLEDLGIRIESTYVRSGAASSGIVQDIFSEDFLSFINEHSPDIFVIDGTKAPLAENKEARFSRAMLAFYDWFSKNQSKVPYNISFYPFSTGDKVVLGDKLIELQEPDPEKPQVIIVNSTRHPSHVSQLSGRLKNHIPGYFDDYDERVVRSNKMMFTRSGLEKVAGVSESRYLGIVQRRIKEAVPAAIMSKESDPNN